MSIAADIARLSEQEAALVFEQFDEGTAFAIGRHVREAALELEAGVSVLVKLWDRPVFYSATPGATHGNYLWCHRKANTVRLTMKSTYRQVLERGDKPRLFDETWGVDPAEYVFAGGAVPVVVKGIGVVGAVAASGLDERQDHEIVVAGMSEVLGLTFKNLALA